MFTEHYVPGETIQYNLCALIVYNNCTPLAMYTK